MHCPGMAATALALELLEPGSHVLAMRRETFLKNKTEPVLVL